MTPFLLVNLLIYLSAIIIVVFIFILMKKLYILIKIMYNDDKLKNIRISSLDRLVAICFYFLPFIETCNNFGILFITDFFIIRVLYEHTLMPILVPYNEFPIIGFFIFLLSYLIFVKEIFGMRFKRFLRFNVAQSLLIYLINTVISTIFASLPSFIMDNILGELLDDIMILSNYIIIGYSIYKAFSGQYSRIPLISEAARIQAQDHE